MQAIYIDLQGTVVSVQSSQKDGFRFEETFTEHAVQRGIE